MRIRHFAIPAAAALAVLLLPEQATQAEAQFVANFGTVAPDNTPWSEQLRHLKKRIESESGGRIKMKLFLGGTLGSEIEMIQDVIRGERLHGGGFSTGAIGEAANIPMLQMVELPYLFQTNEEVDAVLDGVMLDPVNEALEDKGFILIAWAENGWRNFATKGGPATSPSELAKYKMRSQESPVHLDMYKQYGVQAVAKPVSEVLPALNTGIVDGFDNTPLFSIAAGWIEPITHYTMSWHIYQPAGVVFSKKFFDQLPPDLQIIVKGDLLAESAKGRAAVRELEEVLVAQIESRGKTVTYLTEEQRAAFQGPALNVHKAFLLQHPELKPLYAKIRQKLNSMR
jgi:TRAP-type C4-dicarboxylate transport system substrate-binding protein